MKYITRIHSYDLSGIENLLNQFETYWNQKDAKKMALLFIENSEFTDIMGQIAEGRKDIEIMHEMVFQHVMKKAVLTHEIMYLRTIAPDTIMATCKWKTTGHTNPENKPLPERNGIMQVILVLKGEKWMIALIQNLDFTLMYNNIDDYSINFFEPQKHINFKA